MSIVLEYFRVIFISIEFLVILLGAIFFFLWPEYAILISAKLSDNSDFQKYLFAASPILAVYVFNESRKLLFPEKVKKKIFQSWPDYWKLKIHFLVGLLYSGLFAGIGLLTWALGYKVNEPKGFVMLAVSVVGGLVVAVSVYWARIRLPEILADIEE
ncbi:MAG: hypothetical protein WA162_05370 [Thermodesulfobacteriota bacterium]